jgi:hypothetical protein
VYEVCVDTDGDTRADLALRVRFTAATTLHEQHATVSLVAGGSADVPGVDGNVLLSGAPASPGTEAVVTDAEVPGSGLLRFFAGRRSDPFFADLAGAADFSFTGTDFFAEHDVFAIALQVPSPLLLGDRPPGTALGVWARISLIAGEECQQVDRLGQPLVDILFGGDDPDRPYNRTHPSQDRDRYVDAFTAVLQHAGRSEDEARGVALFLLPDVLRYDPSVDGGDPNGHTLTADAVDAALAMMSNGAVTTDLVGPHDDLLDAFPHLGAPHHAGPEPAVR